MHSLQIDWVVLLVLAGLAHTLGDLQVVFDLGWPQQL